VYTLEDNLTVSRTTTASWRFLRYPKQYNTYIQTTNSTLWNYWFWTIWI